MGDDVQVSTRLTDIYQENPTIGAKDQRKRGRITDTGYGRARRRMMQKTKLSVFRSMIRRGEIK